MSRQGRTYKDQKQKANPWAFVVDVAPAGAPRKQQRKRGFRTQKDAQKALNDVLHELQEGTFVEEVVPVVVDFEVAVPRLCPAGW